ncbi:DUF4178 domain-containing protein [Paenibacillus chartarius]|uniref:DUF4178 domain-containing protein n=1 Tax=Paenibacillus chartarius TaxID=747481 RepID=A0ABV6DMB3_9BACL
MSIFKRIGSIVRSNRPEPIKASPPNPYEHSRPGDIIEVDLEQYMVSGKVVYFDRGFEPHRFAYYIQSGKEIRCLIVEKGRTNEIFLCSFLEGSLDDPHNVPTQLDIDGEVTYHLEHHRSDVTRAEGNTDFRTGDDVLFWRYLGADNDYFFLQWQDGKFVALQGNKIPAADVKFLHAGR